MPRHADPDLEERVLDAAQKLWRRGGDKTLSMRALARAAKTNTPAIYRRFKSREDLLRALLLRLRQEVYEAVRSAKSLEQACECYVDFALRRPQEYQLYHAHYHELLGTSRDRRPDGSGEIGPSFLWVQNRLVDRLGGTPEDHVRLTLALWALAHGTAMLLISRSTPSELASELRSACTSAVAELVREAEKKLPQG
jgi:AcrR family transcriptional regulator